MAGKVCAQPAASELRLPVSDGAPAVGRQYVVGACAHWPAPRVDVAALLVSELITNAVLHGSAQRSAGGGDGDGDGGAIVVRVHCAEQSLRIEVTDNDSRPLDLSAITEDIAEGGRGLHIVAALASDWGSHPNPETGKTVWFELERQSE